MNHQVCAWVILMLTTIRNSWLCKKFKSQTHRIKLPISWKDKSLYTHLNYTHTLNTKYCQERNRYWILFIGCTVAKRQPPRCCTESESSLPRSRLGLAQPSLFWRKSGAYCHLQPHLKTKLYSINTLLTHHNTNVQRFRTL